MLSLYNIVHTPQSPNNHIDTTINNIFLVISSSQIKVSLGKGWNLKTDTMDDSFLSKDGLQGLSLFTWCYLRSAEVLRYAWKSGSEGW